MIDVSNSFHALVQGLSGSMRSILLSCRIRLRDEQAMKQRLKSRTITDLHASIEVLRKNGQEIPVNPALHFFRVDSGFIFLHQDAEWPDRFDPENPLEQQAALLDLSGGFIALCQ